LQHTLDKLTGGVERGAIKQDGSAVTGRGQHRHGTPLLRRRLPRPRALLLAMTALGGGDCHGREADLAMTEAGVFCRTLRAAFPTKWRQGNGFLRAPAARSKWHGGAQRRGQAPAPGKGKVTGAFTERDCHTGARYPGNDRVGRDRHGEEVRCLFQSERIKDPAKIRPGLQPGS